MTDVLCPVDPADLPRAQLSRLRVVSEKVAVAALATSGQTDFVLRVYLAGLYHGLELGGERPEKERTT